MTDDREFDLVVYGATGFVGKLICDYLAQSAAAGTRIAIAGRSKDKLKKLAQGLPKSAHEWGVLVADSADRKALDAMAARTKVVLTTVGPYEKYGHEVAGACAAHGTHYVDLTGETLFVRYCADNFDDVARKTGAKIVNSCGFDSIPSDLAVWLAHRQAVESDFGDLTDVTLVVRSMKGGVSGGTVDSMRVQVDQMKEDPQLRKVVTDWYALSPDRAAEPKVKQPSDAVRPHKDAQLGGWVAPFVMAPFNTRLVRRTNALLDWQYGCDFRYREVSCFPDSPQGAAMATAMTAGLAGIVYGFGFKPSRMLLDRVLPKPGEGPSEKTRTNGRFRMQVIADTTSGKKVTSTVAAKGDPGYAATAVMISEAALCLALDELDGPGGVLTPASAMGQALVDRLKAADFTMTSNPL